jgi:branched-chain amino acid transport system ATP-binding protein
VNVNHSDSAHALTVEKLTAGYGKLVILHELSLTVAAQQFVAILGPNGSGKSTLLKTVMGLTRVVGGTIELFGQPLLGRSPEIMADLGLVYVPQRENVFTALTVRENLLLALRKRPRQAAEQALSAAYALFPILQERQRQRAGQLSGGERQMLAIALGWLLEPRVMMLDEPGAGLAPRLVTELFRTLQQLCQSGITMVVVEQNARALLPWCDYAYILREGQTAFQGTAAEILADPETAKGYLGVGHWGQADGRTRSQHSLSDRQTAGGLWPAGGPGRGGWL